MPLATDALGQALTELFSADEPLDNKVGDLPCPLALVVASVQGKVLFGLNGWRRQWELPGGMLEPCETPRAAALRELEEETGVALNAEQLRWFGVATFKLSDPDRNECAAIYSAELSGPHVLSVSNELIELGWFDVHQPSREGVAPLDFAIAQIVLDSSEWCAVKNLQKS